MKNYNSRLSCLFALLFLFSFTACTTTMPVYKVEKSGVELDSAKNLLSSLKIADKEINEGSVLDENGRIYFLDQQYAHVPVKVLGEEKADEDGRAVRAEALNFSALKKLTVFDEKEAINKFNKALDVSGLLPANARKNVTHSRLVLMNKNGKDVIDKALDTRVVISQFAEGIPIEGPGAKISASFDGSGQVTRLKYASRQLKAGEQLAVLTEDEAIKHCQQLYNTGSKKESLQNLKVSTRLFYYSPALTETSVHTLIPYYECSASADVNKQSVQLLQAMIPAISDGKYVPRVNLTVNTKGAKVDAQVDIAGGTPPYKIYWSSPSVELASDKNQVSYTIAKRKIEVDENITVNVVDANGVFVQATEIIYIDPAQVFAVIDVEDVLQEVRDYGVENPVSQQFADLDVGFIDEMNADGVTRRFLWRHNNAWEQDFKAPEDRRWADAVDMTFYVGHGNVGYFTFENDSHDDGYLMHNDANGDWGNTDLEWLALYSCQVLGKGGDGKAPFNNWKQEFDGLHLILGFHTNAQPRVEFSRAFASNMLDDNSTVLQAWMDAIDDHQPDNRVGIVMGVVRKGDGVWNYHDHFHGKGSVGPDIPEEDIDWYWYREGP